MAVTSGRNIFIPENLEVSLAGSLESISNQLVL